MTSVFYLWGILGYKFPISACCSPPYLLPQSFSESLPVLFCSTEILPTFSLLPFLGPYGHLTGWVCYLHPYLSANITKAWWCAYCKFFLKLQEYVGSLKTTDSQIKEMFLRILWVLFNRPVFFPKLLPSCIFKVWEGFLVQWYVLFMIVLIL